MQEFIDDLKACVSEAKSSPGGKGTMVTIYGLYSPFKSDLA